jgi:uncharacterized protein YcaQ
VTPVSRDGRTIRTISLEILRRLAVASQRLAGPPPPAGRDGIRRLIEDLGCIQLDPISVVARSHLLVLRSRIGAFDREDLEALLWQDRSLFEYWAHAASIVATNDYPIHRLLMRTYLTGESGHDRKWRAWVEANRGLLRHVMRRLRRDGPLRTRDLEDRSVVGWRSSGWNQGRNVDRILEYLWARGTIMVAGRSGGLKTWDLSERCLPDWTPRERLSEGQVVRRAAERSLRALGVGRQRDIREHFTRGRYPGLPHALAKLEREGRIERVRVADGGGEWPDPWFVHTHSLPALERIQAGEWEPRTTLLSPFDNLVCDRARTELLFNFRYRVEIYVPKAQREFGYYALPVLHGDRLIGRVDAAMDRKRATLMTQAMHAEPNAPADAGPAVAGAIDDLAGFLGATRVDYGTEVPSPWRRALR